MRKLFFDDVRDVPDETWMLARDVAEAKKLIRQYNFDLMSLDHDIGFQMMCDQCIAECPDYHPGRETLQMQSKLSEGCTHLEHGTTLAHWMVDNVQTWPGLIVLHSANPYGVARMRDILSQFTRCISLRYDVQTLQSLGRVIASGLRASRLAETERVSS